ncbi:MAG: hypothetical protein NXI02_07465 [Rhodobacteraceae bacterium]|nr:hypothetical protein [Paracoccaceae bacterium]
MFNKPWIGRFYFFARANCLIFGRRQIIALLSIRQLEIELLGGKISISEAVKELANETSATASDIDELQNQIDNIKSKFDEIPCTKGAFKQETETTSDEKAVELMLEGLRHNKFTWRSIERLALLAGITKKRAH